MRFKIVIFIISFERFFYLFIQDTGTRVWVFYGEYEMRDETWVLLMSEVKPCYKLRPTVS